jgi:hypothetical protein
MTDAPKSAASMSARDTAYQARVQVALPYLKEARSIGCSTGLHYSAFLNVVGIPAFDGGMWSVRAVNRLIKYAQDNGLIDWHRHRGRRNPGVEAKRVRLFTSTVLECQTKYEASIQPPAEELEEGETVEMTETEVASHNHLVAVIA